MGWALHARAFIGSIFQALDLYADRGCVAGSRSWFSCTRTQHPAPPPRTSSLLFDLDREVRRAAACRARVAPLGQVAGLRSCSRCGTDLPPLAFIDRCRVCGERPGCSR